ncbi:MAG: hydrogenase maturation protease [Maritimibacter sp.]|nr:hydrogenase maturation protease [Maritimibacter sp.]
MPGLLAELNRDRSLIHGIGNVGRQDDGLGWAFIDRLEAEGLCPRAEKRRHYQMFLEDADLISGFDRVLFVDASKEPGLKSFRLDPVAARYDLSFTSHALTIPAVMAICKQCFDRVPEVQLLSIRGYSWDLTEGLTAEARANLEAAQGFFAAAQGRAPVFA